MNVIAPIRPKISPEEQARRKAAVDAARASVRLEGFIVSPFTEELYSRFIEGEITVKELGAKIRSHYTP
jgi:Antitoxin VbhA